MVRKLKYCYVCGERKAIGRHHIVPRKENGNDSLRNILNTCRECHNLIEDKSWLEIQTLRSDCMDKRKKIRQKKSYYKAKERVYYSDKSESKGKGHVSGFPTNATSEDVIESGTYEKPIPTNPLVTDTPSKATFWYKDKPCKKDKHEWWLDMKAPLKRRVKCRWCSTILVVSKLVMGKV